MPAPPAPPASEDSRITLLTKPGCHLCDVARPVLARVAAEYGLDVAERDITADLADYARWADWIPVTLIDGAEHAVFAVEEDRLRAALSAISGQATVKRS